MKLYKWWMPRESLTNVSITLKVISILGSRSWERDIYTLPVCGLQNTEMNSLYHTQKSCRAVRELAQLINKALRERSWSWRNDEFSVSTGSSVSITARILLVLPLSPFQITFLSRKKKSNINFYRLCVIEIQTKFSAIIEFTVCKDP